MNWKGGVSKMKLNCKFCNKEFTGTHQRKFCSKECYWKFRSLHYRGKNHNQWKGGRLKIKCKNCNQEFRGYSNQKFCSVTCASSWKWKGKGNPNWKNGITYNMKIYRRNWNRQNLLSIKIKKQREYARKKGAEGSHTLSEWTKLKEKFHFKCTICGISEEALLKETMEGLTLDHIIPLSKGGTDYINNCQPLCRRCNGKKSDKISNSLLLDNLFKNKVLLN